MLFYIARRLGYMILVLVVVSFAWVAVVDSTPAEERSYVGSSQTNSEMELIFGHNDVHLFLIPPQNNSQSALTQWIAASCARLPYLVPRALQGAPSSPLGQNGTPQLFNCTRG